MQGLHRNEKLAPVPSAPCPAAGASTEAETGAETDCVCKKVSLPSRETDREREEDSLREKLFTTRERERERETE